MRKQKKKEQTSTRELIGIGELTDYSIRTQDQHDLVFFMIKPSNLSVLSEGSIAARIYAMMTVLKGLTEIEMLCLNSSENFEGNKDYLRQRAQEENNPVIAGLLAADQNFLDHIQVTMATAREFLIIIRLKDEKKSEVMPYLNRIEKSLREQGFSSRRAGEADLKRILAVYFEQNVTTESFESVDGERWVILND